MNKLQVLKVLGNPLTRPLKNLLALKESDVASTEMTDNEKDVALTLEVKKFLKNQQYSSNYVEANGESMYVSNCTDLMVAHLFMKGKFLVTRITKHCVVEIVSL